MDILNDVIDRLSGLGFSVTQQTEDDITFAINEACERIKTETNLNEVPEGLRYVWIDMAAGAVLRDKLAAGQLGPELDFSGEAKRITEGDVTVELNTAASGAAHFNEMIERMADPPKAVFAAYRRLKW